VRNAADVWELPIEFEMSRQVRGRTQIALDDFSIEARDYHVPGPQRFVGDTTGLNGDQAIRARNAAGVAEGVEHKAAPNQFQVGLEYFLPQSLQEHGSGSK
jgi:hypothetical protein